MTMRDKDCVVVGAGPAGLTAARAVAEAGLSVVAIDRMGPGGQLMNLGDLRGEGLEPGATGPDLMASLTDEAMSAGAEIAIDDVARAWPEDGAWRIDGLDASYRARALIVASGLTPGTAGMAEESRFEGQGISHCAHCDAPLYAGKSVVVAGADAWAVEEAIELAHHAGRVVLVAPAPLAAPPERLAALRDLGTVEVVKGRIVGLEGASALEVVRLETPDGPRAVAASGLFLYTGRTPATGFLAGVGEDAAGLPGLFRAGDVRPAAAQSLAEAIADGRQQGQNAVIWVMTGGSA